MKKILAVTALMIFSSIVAFAQSTPPRDTDNTATRSQEPRRTFGWIGLLGLAGLAGLRRPKSEASKAFESRGVNVKTV